MTKKVITDTLNIKVTKKAIQEGIRGDSQLCPVCVSIKDRYPHLTRIIVSYNWVSVGYDDVIKTFQTSKKLKEFIDRIDEQQPLQPTTFVLRTDEERNRYKTANEKIRVKTKTVKKKKIREKEI